MDERAGDFDRFVRGETDPRAFPHEQHVRMGFEVLRRYDFPEAAHVYCQGLRTMTQRIGQPQLFHQTVTIAFLSLIAERMQAGAGAAADFPCFAAENPDLFDKSVLSRWYRPERLASDLARRTFVLPDGAAHSRDNANSARCARPNR